MQDTTKVAIDH